MNLELNQKLLDLLADHADALNESGDAAGFDTAVWLTQRAPTYSQNLLSLLQLAKSLKLTLKPVKPSVFFRSDLRNQLEQSALTDMAEKSIGRLLWLVAAVIGSVVSIIVILHRLKLLPGASDVMGTAV